jgi:hypothetical protein
LLAESLATISIPEELKNPSVPISDSSEQPAKLAILKPAKAYMLKHDFIWKPLLRKFRQYVRSSFIIKNCGNKNQDALPSKKSCLAFI